MRHLVPVRFRRAALLVLAGVAALVYIAGRLQAVHARTAAGLRWEPAVADLGTMLQGDRRSTRFVLHNVRPEPIQILGVQSSCSCTVVSRPRKPIAPGGHAEMAVDFDSHRWQGRIKQTVRVSTSAGGEPGELTLRATVRPAVVAQPDILSFGPVAPGAAPEATTKLRPDPALPPLRGTVVKTSADYVHATVRPAGRDLLVSVALRDPPVGDARAYVDVRTNSTRVPQVRVPITARVHSKWALSSQSLSLGIVPRGAAAVARITIFGLRRDQVLGVASTLREVQAELATGPTAHDVAIKATCAGPQKHRGPLEGSVLLTTSDPAAPRLVFPVDVVLQGPKTGCCD